MKRTWKKHYIGLAVPQSMAIEMDNTIWQSFMKMQSEWNEISNRLSIGIDLLHCKTMIWQSRNAKNLESLSNYTSHHNEQFANFQFVCLSSGLIQMDRAALAYIIPLITMWLLWLPFITSSMLV